MPGVDGNTVRAYYDSGTGASWRDWANVQGFYQGSWRQATDVYANDNGMWKKVWIRLTAPTSVTTSFSTTSLNGTISWSGAQGAAGYYIYRNGVYSASASGGASSAAVTVPDYETSYTFSVASFYANVISSPVSAAPVLIRLPKVTASGYLQQGYVYSNNDPNSQFYYLSQLTPTPDWILPGPLVVTLTWTGIPGVANYRLVDNNVVGQVNLVPYTASYNSNTNTYSMTLGTTTSTTYQIVPVANNGVVGTTRSNSISVNVGSPRTRALASSPSLYDQDAQGSYPGTTNGQAKVNFLGSMYAAWVYRVRVTISVTFSPYIANWPGRRLRIFFPGRTVDIADNTGTPSSFEWGRDEGDVVAQNVYIATDPYYSGDTSSWSISGSGTIGTYHCNVKTRVYYSYITANEIAPTVSVGT